MAGIVTVEEITLGSVKKIKWSWTSSAGGVADSAVTIFKRWDGRIIGLCTVPDGVDAPDPNYGVTVKDADGVDILLGAGLLRHTSNTEYVAEASMAGVAHSSLILQVTAAGNAKKGTVYLYIR